MVCFWTRRRNSWKEGVWKVWHAITVQAFHVLEGKLRWAQGCAKFKNYFRRKVWAFRPHTQHPHPNDTFEGLLENCVQQIHGSSRFVQTLYIGESPRREIVLTWLCYYRCYCVIERWIIPFIFVLDQPLPPPPRKLEDLCRLNIFSFVFYISFCQLVIWSLSKIDFHGLGIFQHI